MESNKKSSEEFSLILSTTSAITDFRKEMSKMILVEYELELILEDAIEVFRNKDSDLMEESKVNFIEAQTCHHELDSDIAIAKRAYTNLINSLKTILLKTVDYEDGDELRWFFWRYVGDDIYLKRI